MTDVKNPTEVFKVDDNLYALELEEGGTPQGVHLVSYCRLIVNQHHVVIGIQPLYELELHGRYDYALDVYARMIRQLKDGRLDPENPYTFTFEYGGTVEDSVIGVPPTPGRHLMH